MGRTFGPHNYVHDSYLDFSNLVTFWQDPNDLVAIQQIVWDIKPKVIFDIGTNVGGSAIVYAHIMSAYVKPGEALIITVDPRHYSQNWDDTAKEKCPKCTPVSDNPLWSQYVQFVQAKSVDAPAISALESAIKKYGGPVLLSVDGTHEYDGVLEELRKLHKYVTVGSYMIVQDTKLDRLWDRKAALQAARDFLKENEAAAGPKFIADRKREVFRYSQHVEGFLLRVK
ncbi:hypothetical protein HXX76_015781 [Chlamydomonas incerta]|uniref:Rhamnosyl O-methyltransferase n=1 Tax=Chlamydomonas incerta TaxID=51695 RepID=A0A835SBZ8_CHLIN|nr:hypothetical protein HXX76_015781 [Chlamydomonas incerta]|eukprot:KAG2422761.1 hypothetical protein HXX76_015781 [Chlamydomonas incerta]